MVRFKLSQQEIGELVDAILESQKKRINTGEDKGLISQQSGQIAIRDLDLQRNRGG